MKVIMFRVVGTLKRYFFNLIGIIKALLAVLLSCKILSASVILMSVNTDFGNYSLQNVQFNQGLHLKNNFIVG